MPRPTSFRDSRTLLNYTEGESETGFVSWGPVSEPYEEDDIETEVDSDGDVDVVDNDESLEDGDKEDEPDKSDDDGETEESSETDADDADEESEEDENVDPAATTRLGIVSPKPVKQPSNTQPLAVTSNFSLTFEQRISNQLRANNSNFSTTISFSPREAKQGLKHLQNLDRSRGKLKNSIQLAQQFLLLDPQNTRPTRNRNGLVIGVDATPSHYGGYCVNLAEATLEYYIVEGSDIPWEICKASSSSEFEMKNMMFALSLWNQEIEKVKILSIFTDNSTICQREPTTANGHNYGIRVRTLLSHFAGCHGVGINSPNYVNRNNDSLTFFAQYIQPADDLSRLRIGSCVDYLCKLYLIDRKNVKGTHHKKPGCTDSYCGSASLDPTPFFHEALQKVMTFVHSLNCVHRANLELELKVKRTEVEPGGRKKRKRNRSKSSGSKKRRRIS